MNKNLSILAKLYDSSASDLAKALDSQAVTFNDPRIQDKVRWLGDVARTLQVVYQIETMRTKSVNKDATVSLPDEQVVEDPALKKAKKGQFAPNNTANDLSGFRSPGGWTP